PNATIARSSIRNFSKPTRVARRSVFIPAGPELPPSRLVSLILETLTTVPRVLRHPLPTILVKEYQESRVLYEVRYFTDDFRLGVDTDGLVLERLWYAFERQGISIPLPQRQVALREGLAARDEARQAELARADEAL